MNRRLTSIGVVVRKDLLMLWPLGAAVAALHLLMPWRAEVAQWMSVSDLFAANFVAIIGSALFALVVVHNDPSFSSRHDWLIRPIHRFDMVIAKVLVLVATVFLPWLFGDMAHHILGHGASLGESLLAASGQFAVFAWLLPVLAFAAVTGALVEALVGLACLMIAAVGCLWAADVAGDIFVGTSAIVGDGRDWANPWLTIAVAALGCGLALWLQYGRRRTRLARGILLGAAAVGGTIMLTQPVVAAGGESEMVSEVAFGEPTVCERPHFNHNRYDGARAPYGLWSDTLASSRNWGQGEHRAAGGRPHAIVVGAKVTGLPQGWTAVFDRLEARYGSVTGPVIPYGGQVLSLPGAPPTLASSWLTSEADLAPLKRADAHFQLDARMILMKPARSYRIPADGRSHRMKGLGYCSVEPATSSAVVRCLTGWPAPPQLAARFADQPEGCKLNCDNGPDMALIPAWGQLPITRDYRVLIETGGVPSARGREVVVTVLKPAGHVNRRTEWRGPVGACERFPNGP